MSLLMLWPPAPPPLQWLPAMLWCSGRERCTASTTAMPPECTGAPCPPCLSSKGCSPRPACLPASVVASRLLCTSQSWVWEPNLGTRKTAYGLRRRRLSRASPAPAAITSCLQASAPDAPPDPCAPPSPSIFRSVLAPAAWSSWYQTRPLPSLCGPERTRATSRGMTCACWPPSAAAEAPKPRRACTPHQRMPGKACS